ncbi:MAG TPA: hypothetical protein VKE22_02505 [Haliangiales bacterium]|nr:hypothetical protein [Haliangiales bacterium]
MLERSAAVARRPWYRAHAAGIVSLAVGFAALIVGYWLQFHDRHEITELPDLRVMLPLFAVAAAAGITALVRREPRPVLPILGIGLATAAIVLGWFLLVLAVAAATSVILLLVLKLN